MPAFLRPLVALFALATAASAQDHAYPVLLTDFEAQAALGVVEGAYGPPGRGPLENLCYYYGDGGSLLSVSDEFLAIYEARGFSLRTLCLGMVSGIVYNPETGARLATVQAVDIKEATAPDYFGEPGPIGPETPVELPDCFRNGLPLTECAFRFDPFSGAPLTETETAAIARAGTDARIKANSLLRSGRYAEPCPGDDHPSHLVTRADGQVDILPFEELEYCYVERAAPYPGAPAYLLREFYAEANHPDLFPFGGFIDFSPAFQAGYAFAIYADGAAGPSFELGDAGIRIAGKDRSNQAVIESLKLKASGAAD